MSIFEFKDLPDIDGADITLGDGSIRRRSLRIPAGAYSTPFWVHLDGQRSIRVDSLPRTITQKCGSVRISSEELATVVAVPTGLVITETGVNSVVLSWDAHPDAALLDGFIAYWSDIGDPTKSSASQFFSGGSTTGGTLLSLPSSSTITVRISAVTPGSIESDLSDSASDDTSALPEPGDQYAPFELEAIYPQPDNITQSFARHRHAHTDMLYQIPIGVRGGAWPFRYELIEGPAWLDIIHELPTFDATTSTYWPEFGYGVLSGTAPSTPSGPHDIVVRVTDMLDNFVELAWTVSVDNSNFLHVDQTNGSDTTGDGTIGNPYQNVYHINNTLSTGARNGKIVVIHGTDYTMPAHSDVGSLGWWKAGTNQPSAYISSDDEVIDLDCSNIRRAVDFGAKADTFISGFHFIDCGQNDPPPNVRVIHAANSFVDRSVFWNLHCTNPHGGTSGTDNPGFVILFRPGVNGHNNIYLADCTGTNFPEKTNGNDFYSGFNVRKILIERNIAIGFSGGNCNIIYLKGTHRWATVRANTLDRGSGANATRTGIGFCAGDDVDGAAFDFDICFNRISPSANRGSIGVNDNFEVAPTLAEWNAHIYRNSVRGNISIHRGGSGGSGPNPEASIYFNVIRTLSGNGTWKEDVGNIATSPDDPFDANINLVEPYRTDHLGSAGAELTEIPEGS